MEFLLEVGCEEIPARFVPPALAALEVAFRAGLDQARLADEALELRVLGTPRRLSLVARGLRATQPDLDEEILGPRVSAAFDAAGAPTPTCLGFARSRGVEVAALLRVASPKGEVLAVRRSLPGRPAREVLVGLVESCLAGLTFPRSMRWGTGEHAFARPVHWLLALLDGEVLPVEFAGQRADRFTRGHRFTHPGALAVQDARDYLAQLGRADVLVEPEARRARVEQGARALAASAGGRLVPDEGLAEELTWLTEWPLPLLGHFRAEFLELPRAVLVAAMRNHQRYHSIEREDGRLLNAFVAVSNTPVEDEAVVVRGYERVLTARLSDADFFYRTDRATALVERLPRLQEVIFQADLGSYYEKSIRVANLAVALAHALGLGGLERIPRVIEATTVRLDALSQERERFSWKVARAALLSKTDLLTEMVREFPELQGEMGGHYAARGGEDSTVAEAIEDHYRPRFATDAIPRSDVGALVALADKLDTLAGCFGLGLKPTGGADPYALRRACLGVIAISLGRGYRFSLRRALMHALAGVRERVAAARLQRAQEKARRAAARKKTEAVLPSAAPPFEAEVLDELLEFFAGRLRQRLAEGAPQDVVDAVLGAGLDDLTETQLRVQALSGFTRTEAYLDLAVAFKRVSNILKGFECAELDPGLFVVEEERRLFEVYRGAAPRVDAAVDSAHFDEALAVLAAELRLPVDRFFDKVLVNDPDDPARQANRKALLGGIQLLFGRIADFTRLQTPDAG
jgi:glycyl-tRNA synthetase beta chain